MSSAPLSDVTRKDSVQVQVDPQGNQASAQENRIFLLGRASISDLSTHRHRLPRKVNQSQESSWLDSMPYSVIGTFLKMGTIEVPKTGWVHPKVFVHLSPQDMLNHVENMAFLAEGDFERLDVNQILAILPHIRLDQFNRIHNPKLQELINVIDPKALNTIPLEILVEICGKKLAYINVPSQLYKNLLDQIKNTLLRFVSETTKADYANEKELIIQIVKLGVLKTLRLEEANSLPNEFYEVFIKEFNFDQIHQYLGGFLYSSTILNKEDAKGFLSSNLDIKYLISEVNKMRLKPVETIDRIDIERTKVEQALPLRQGIPQITQIGCNGYQFSVVDYTIEGHKVEFQPFKEDKFKLLIDSKATYHENGRECTFTKDSCQILLYPSRSLKTAAFHMYSKDVGSKEIMEAVLKSPTDLPALPQDMTPLDLALAPKILSSFFRKEIEESYFDNRILQGHGITYEQIGEKLETITRQAIAQRRQDNREPIIDNAFKVKMVTYRSMGRGCPLGCPSDKNMSEKVRTDFTVTNVHTGKSIEFSELHPHLASKDHLLAGLDPFDVIDVLYQRVRLL